MVTLKVDFFVWETISGFRAVQRYFELIESQIEKVKDEEWQKLKQLPVPEDEEERQTEYGPIIQSHKREFEKVLPTLFGYSFVMMLFSELEFRIIAICRELRKRESIPLKIGDLNGNLIEKFSKFLIVANKPQLKDNEKSDIADFIAVRNCIVHNNGFLINLHDKNKRKLRNVAKNKLHIEIVGKGNKERVKVLSGFLYSRIELFISMFQRLFKTLNFGPEFPIILNKNNSEDI